MPVFQKKLIAFAFIVFAFIILIFNLPDINEFRYGADEGNYLRQAGEIANNGIAGIKNNAVIYLSNPEHPTVPNPMRLFHLVVAAIFLKFNSSIVSLSVLSVLCYIALLIVSFYYVRKFWNIDIALVSTLLLCISPLGLALSRRALSDGDYYLFSSLALFLFIDHILKPANYKFYLFLLFLVISWLIRETTIFLIPFFAGYLLFYNIRYLKKINFKEILLTSFLPFLIVFLIYILFFGITDTVTIMKVPVKGELGAPSGYTIYTQGSWYYYILGYFMLSPVITFFSFGFIGYTLLRKEIDKKELLLILLFIYLFIPLALSHKEMRYGINFDIIIRIFFALFLYRFYDIYKPYFSNQLRKVLILLAFLSIVFFDLKAFNNYFLVNKIYNPILYNMMEVEKFIPSESDFAAGNAMQNQKAAEQKKSLEEQVKTNPTPENCYALALQYYNNSEFDKCIAANLKAIELKPDFAEAYNNLGAAYGSIGDFAKEIAVCEQALKLKPDFQLAKNNLQWAKSQLNKSK